ncbi:MAG: ATP-binding protein, partial [Candidatus Binatia bacterium]
EEIVQSLFDRGVLRRNGTVIPTRPVGEIEIPATVQGVLAARIDRLHPEQKELLQTAAVIGREFSAALLRSVVGGEVDHDLDELVRAEFVREESHSTEPRYVFKHALTQETAYGSLLIERRRALHELTAQAIERLFAGRLEDHYAELAFHYGRGADTERAIRYLLLAGRQAVDRSSSGAVDRFNEALALVETLAPGPQRVRHEVRLQMDLGAALQATKGYASPEVERCVVRATELSAEIDDAHLRFWVLAGLESLHCHRGKLRAALEVSEEMLRIAKSTGATYQLVWAWRACGRVARFRGNPLEARRHLEESLARYDPKRVGSYGWIRDPRIVCLTDLAYILSELGYPDQGLEKAREAMALARASEIPRTFAGTLATAADVRALRGEWAETARLAEEFAALSEKHGLAFYAALADVSKGRALLGSGRVEEGIEHISRALAALRASGGGLSISLPFVLSVFAQAHARIGNTDRGFALLEEAFTLASASEGWLVEPTLLWVKGEVFVSTRPPRREEAEACFLRALEIAHAREAKWAELRTATALARLLRTQGRSEEARSRLAEIYGWFTEGFDTANLRDARALLEELS